MNIRVNNANFDFKYLLPEDDWMGSSELYVPKDLMIEFINDNTAEDIDLNSYDPEESDVTPNEITSFLEFDQETIAQWIEDGMSDTYCSDNADAQIVLFYHLIDSDLDDINLEYHGENPYWLLHDICHSRNDVSEFGVYVDQYIEEDRIFDGMELALELGILSHVNGDLIMSITKGFKERWNHSFDKNRAIEFLNTNT